MKRVMRSALVMAVSAPLTVALSFAQPGVSHACSCAYFPGDNAVEQQIADFATGDGAVFTGTPVAERREDWTVFYDFDVREVFRGNVGATTSVSTPSDSAACGTGFDLKEEYLVFATTYDRQGAAMSVNGCSATTLSTDGTTRSATVARFGEPRELTASEQDPLFLPILIGVCAVAAVAVGAAGWSLWRARR